MQYTEEYYEVRGVMLCTAEDARITESVVTSCGKSLMLKVRYEIFTFTNID